MNKKFYISLIIVVVLFVLISVFYTGTKDKKESLVLVLDFGASQRKFKIAAPEQERAWNILQQVAAVSGTNLEATEDFRPRKIDGLADGSGNKHWVFYVDGIKQKTSPFDVFVKAPTELTFRFE